MSKPLNLSSPMSELVHDYYEELLSFLTIRLRSRDQATDVTQETFLRIASLASLRSLQNPRAFLYKTAINITIDLFRRQKKQTLRLVDLEEAQAFPSVHPDPERTLAGKEDIHRLSQAIADLPPKCRHVFLLHKVKGKSHREIAEGLGISRNMVEKHIMKGLAYCRQRLEENT